MTRTEHLLLILAEECAEVAQRVSKALRFSLDEVQPGQDQTNGQRIMYEMADLIAVADMLEREGVLSFADDHNLLMRAKQAKVEHYLLHSAENGCLSGDESVTPSLGAEG